MEEERRIHILVVAKPGVMRNSLVSYLRAIPNVSSVLLADTAAAALPMIREIALGLVVMDTDISESDVVTLVKRVHTERPALAAIVLADSVRQQRLCMNHGARRVLLKGLLDEQLRRAVLNDIQPV